MTMVYFEWMAALVLMLNTVYHFGRYVRRTFYLDSVVLSPTQKKLLGVSDSGTVLVRESRNVRSACGVCIPLPLNVRTT